MKAVSPLFANTAARRSGWIPSATSQSLFGSPSTAVMSRQRTADTSPPAFVERTSARPLDLGGTPSPKRS